MKRFPLFLLIAALAAAAPAFAQQQGGANFETRLSALEDEMRMLNGQIEQLGFSISRLDQNVQRLQSDYDARLAKLETSVGTLTAAAEARAAAPPVAPGNMDGTLGALKTQPDGRVTGAINNPQAPVLPETPPDYGLTAQEQYDRALGLLRQANYEEADKAFKTFIEKFPKDKMIDNAKYWHAETLYVRGQFADAATAFAEAFQQNPHGIKAPDSLLKLAKSLEALNKPADACVALGQLKAGYPNAAVSVKSQASEERAKLKCKAP